MSTYSIPLSNPVGTKVFVDTANGATAVQILTGAGTVYSIEIDNSNNSAKAYTKFVDSAGTPTVGTTAPEIQVPTAGGDDQGGLSFGPQGYGITNGLWMWTVTDPGTAGTSGPTNNVTAKVHV